MEPPDVPKSRVVELIAPSGYPPDEAVVSRGIGRLEQAGCVVRNIEATQRRYQRFAGTPAQRAAEINRLAQAGHMLPDVALAVRGGYGAVHVLPALDYDALRRRLAGAPMVLVGHSDFTALQMALWQRAGLTTFGGPMLAYDFGAPTPSEFTMAHFWRTITSPTVTVSWTVWPDDTSRKNIDAEGRLWGGNLAMLCSLLGTPYFPDIAGGILFVEDINEHPFRIERMLYQLHLSGVLARQRALVLGDFSGHRLTDYDNGYNFSAMLAHLRPIVGIPIVTGLPFGHCENKLTLPFGGLARLRAQGDQASLVLSQYPYLPS
ncbi:muramoyltetrapeptide carboxypeptidase [Pandoraea thiooxydans]|uniref:LD-carboxypeptidase n=1 Tax=Pandoraea thiooxydans TaxID=445709 RepID=A0A0G3ES64_9BURK|nr:muramoyltetrapeptide carboxypeptidase [Pandoraea thiooxydans]